MRTPRELEQLDSVGTIASRGKSVRVSVKYVNYKKKHKKRCHDSPTLSPIINKAYSVPKIEHDWQIEQTKVSRAYKIHDM